MPLDRAQLEGLAAGLRISLDGPSTPEPGQAVGVHIPAVAPIDFTEILNGKLDLTVVAKNVLYENAKTEPAFGDAPFDPGELNSAITGGLPIPTAPTEPDPKVPGLLGQLAGNLPIPVTTSAHIQLQAQWSVSSDEEGDNLLVQGQDFTAPNGLDKLDASFVFRPDLVPLTSLLPAPATRYIQLKLTLTVPGVEPVEKDVPPVPIFVPVIPLPTLAALFRHSAFAVTKIGDEEPFILFVVPSGSPLGSLEQVRSLLAQLKDVAALFRDVTDFGPLFPAFSRLGGALAAGPALELQAASRIPNLNDVVLIQNPLLANDIEAAEEISSIIVVGPQGTGIKLWNRTFDAEGKPDEGGGSFSLTVGAEKVVSIPYLSAVPPQPEQPNTVTLGTAPPSGVTFNNQLSALEFL